MPAPMHLQMPKDHGYAAIAEVDITDADGAMSVPVASGTHFTENLVGTQVEVSIPPPS